MSKDSLGILAIVLIAAGLITGFVGTISIAWVLVLAGICLIIYAKLRKS